MKNRRLYVAGSNHFVTLGEISALIQDGKEVVIYDAKTDRTPALARKGIPPIAAATNCEIGGPKIGWNVRKLLVLRNVERRVRCDVACQAPPAIARDASWLICRRR